MAERGTGRKRIAVVNDDTAFLDLMYDLLEDLEGYEVLICRESDQVYDYVLSEGTPQYYQEFLVRFPHDPRCDQIRRLLANLTLAAAWHEAVLANSPRPPPGCAVSPRVAG